MERGVSREQIGLQALTAERKKHRPKKPSSFHHVDALMDVL